MRTILLGGVCSTVMDSLSLQMAEAAMRNAKTPEQMMMARTNVQAAKARQIAERYHPNPPPPSSPPAFLTNTHSHGRGRACGALCEFIGGCRRILSCNPCMFSCAKESDVGISLAPRQYAVPVLRQLGNPKLWGEMKLRINADVSRGWSGCAAASSCRAWHKAAMMSCTQIKLCPGDSFYSMPRGAVHHIQCATGPCSNRVGWNWVEGGAISSKRKRFRAREREHLLLPCHFCYKIPHFRNF